VEGGWNSTAQDTDYEAVVAFGRKHQADFPIAIRA